MKLLGLGVAAAVLLATAPAMAADPIVDVPVIEEATDLAWDGAYAGIGGIAYVAPGGSGVGAVGTVGVNQTFGDNLLLGAEIFAGLGLDNPGGLFWLVGAEGRLGVLASDTVLLYGAGGVELDVPGGFYGTLGGGVEFAVQDDVTIDVEYKYYFGAGTAHQIGVSLNWGF